MSYRTYACDSRFQHLVAFYVNARNWLHYCQSVDFSNYGEFLSLWNESNLGSLSPERIDLKWAGWYMERWCGIWGMIVWYRVYVIHGVWGVRDIWSMVVIYGVVVWYTILVSMGHSWSHLVWNGLNIANMVSIWVVISCRKLNWTYLVSISLILSGHHMALPTMVLTGRILSDQTWLKTKTDSIGLKWTHMLLTVTVIIYFVSFRAQAKLKNLYI